MNLSNNRQKFDVELIYNHQLFGVLGIILSIICFLFVGFSNVDQTYFAIIVLPIAMFFISCIVFITPMFLGIGSFCIFISYLLRFAIMPMILIEGDFICDYDQSLYIDYFSTACYIMAYEGLVVYVLLVFFTPKLRKRANRLSVIEDAGVDNVRQDSKVLGAFFGVIPSLLVAMSVLHIDYLSQHNRGNIYQLAFAMYAIRTGMMIGMYNFNIFILTICYQGIVIFVAYWADLLFRKNKKPYRPLSKIEDKLCN